jgi:hypothetical protein
MRTRLVFIATFALGWIVAVCPALAQPLPVPIVPPLPIPPLPLPAIDTAPDSSADRRPSETPGPERSLPPSWNAPTTSPEGPRASTDAEKEALRRSMVHENWYGWQMLVVDGAAVGLFLLGAAVVTTHAPSPDVTSARWPIVPAAAAIGIYALAPSAIHLTHGNGWKGLGSIALRTTMPLAGFAIGYLGSGLFPTSAARANGSLAAVVGGAGAMAADAALLGWDRWYGPASASHRAFFSVDQSF